MSIMPSARSRDVVWFAAFALAGCGHEPLRIAPSATSTVTPTAGGVVALPDGSARLDVPPGAVAATTSITIALTAGTAPSGVPADSPLFELEPAGLVFAVPARITFAFKHGVRPTVYWSNAAGGFDAVGGRVEGSTISAAVSHFSRGFVGELVGVSGAVDGGDDGPVTSVAPSEDAAIADAQALADAAAARPPIDAGAGCGARAGTWVNRALSPQPPSWPITRNNPALAYDVTTATTVMYGGYGGPGAQFLQDTWEWNGSAGAWTERKGSLPASFDGTSVTYDTARARIVMFASLSGQLWEWNGPAALWEQRSPPTPSAAWPPTSSEFAASAAYDPDRRRVVVLQTMYGVAPGTWEWNPVDGTWSDRSVSPSPGGLQWLVWDPARKRCMGFGGQTLNEVWEWDGQAGTWTMRPKVGAWPEPRSGSAMVLDAGAGRPLLFGGQAPGGPFNPALGPPPPPTPYAQLWEWDGELGTWRLLDDGASGPAPLGRTGHAMTYDSARSCVVMFGGWTSTMSLASTTSDLWEWTRAATLGPSCDGGP